MRGWFALSLLLCAGAAQAAPWEGGGWPIASHFDLSRSLTDRIAFGAPPQLLSAAGRWTLHELEVPPGPPHDPPLVRLRGKHVKVRIPL
jgi:hypothetical protein